MKKFGFGGACLIAYTLKESLFERSSKYWTKEIEKPTSNRPNEENVVFLLESGLFRQITTIHKLKSEKGLYIVYQRFMMSKFTYY